MALKIEDYAIIGDCKTAALVGRDGSIDWLCWPRFDSAACFAALLGTPENGRWLIAPKHPVRGVSRRYRPGTLVLETEFQTETGSATIVDFMPPGDGTNLVRIAIGQSGRVEFRTDLWCVSTTGRQCHGSVDWTAGRSMRLSSYAPTGGIVAAATTSLPEHLGGVRNWDYRYCWLRDATFTLLALMHLGYYEEARAWRDWLIRA